MTASRRHLRTAILDEAVRLDLAGQHRLAEILLSIVSPPGELARTLDAPPPEWEPITEAELDAEAILQRIFGPDE